MTTMTPARFIALTEAYGADRRRWPEAERAMAEAFAARHPELVGQALANADALDALLFASRPLHPSTALRDRVIAAASVRQGRKTWLNRLGLAMGAGWAAAACAGVVAGVVLTDQFTANAQADAVLYQSMLVGVDDTEVLG
ncbi:MAG: hypothetical protein JHC81_07970 [Brevundimonas sp.]|uniref:hypothetical protein n=1 Tax=Brevundimonas sp. TaxID=1871086 RepID=UPI001A1949FC|nr:hypothetical protein [Brevundimonas sp.]MBJ7447456.1 hypothetical protein [Brevundimonas sp.]